ncbi:methyl-accepting chemotaxis protein [Mangrovibacter plantisponsor]|uniref:Methyl-accepting chemotaxis sensory transducer with TarH sensor n=1 Tax=Mangrovibacter plantisponsor TaxID=451513 RepID=A0A317PNW0_9ENTR|nr:methyl-accepting chemotaxis protein [Mangrovibacter plantisponsor]PWW02682.1 methyl-accepting chemotaxis sensory transducer with TarH sensor [Mangrovibacter plantisponsor]
MQILKDITVRKMLLIILAVFTLIWGVATTLTLKNFTDVSQLLEQNSVQKHTYAMLVKGNDQYFRTMTRMLRAVDFRQSGDEASAEKTFVSAGKALKISQDMLAQFRQSQHPGIDDALVQQMVNDWETLLNTIAPMLQNAQANNIDSFRQTFRHVYPPLSVQFGATAEKYTQAIQSGGMVQQAQDHITSNRFILLAALVAGIVTLFLTDRYLVAYLVRPVGIIKRHLERLTAGQLQHNIDDFGRNCAGQLIPYIRSMQDSLRDTVTVIRDSSGTIYTSTSQIRKGNEELSGRTDQQAAALQQTAASMEELTSTVKNNAENVHQARQLTDEAQGIAQKGGEITNTVVKTMAGISESSQKIADITSVINSISFQTNILALNAAVEAARAGEQGRGFAVVASEVRSLAQRSAQAAKEIEGLISESVSRVTAGAGQVQEAGKAMETIIASVSRVRELMGEISVASDEQSRGIDQIGQAMNAMDSVTQQNAAQVQQAATSAAALEMEAEHLTGAIAVFDLGSSYTAKTNSEVRKPALKPTQGVKAITANTGENWETF